MNLPFTPTPAYRLFLDRLIKSREERGCTQTELGEMLGLTPEQVAAYESGEIPLGFIDVRSWLLALDMPFVQFTQELDEQLESSLTHDETIAPPTSEETPQIAPDRPFSPPQSYIDLITRLKEARITMGLEISDVADVVGTGVDWATKAENLQWPVDFTMLRSWCELLDVPFMEFVAALTDVDGPGATEPPVHEASVTSDGSSSIYSHMATPPAPENAPEVPTIEVLFFAIDAAPEVRKIPNTLEAKQDLVGGLITTFETGIEGTVGIANDEALVLDMDPNRLIPATGTPIFGPFLVAGDAGPNFRSLTPHELERAIDHLAPEVPQADFLHRHYAQPLRGPSVDGSVELAEPKQ